MVKHGGCSTTRYRRRTSSKSGVPLWAIHLSTQSTSSSCWYIMKRPRSAHLTNCSLQGNILSTRNPYINTSASVITYFPASDLPSDPARRFADLFLTRTRWKAEEISPFLIDIAVDNKERDKLLLKYARAVTDSDGVWYTARAKLA
jgi:hypothetical protein